MAVFGAHMNQAAVYYSGHRYHKDLIRAHILCCFAESSTPINKEEDHIISSGSGSTYTVVTFLPVNDIYRLIRLTAWEQSEACFTHFKPALTLMFHITKNVLVRRMRNKTLKYRKFTPDVSRKKLPTDWKPNDTPNLLPG